VIGVIGMSEVASDGARHDHPPLRRRLRQVRLRWVRFMASGQHAKVSPTRRQRGSNGAAVDLCPRSRTQGRFT